MENSAWRLVEAETKLFLHLVSRFWSGTRECLRHFLFGSWKLERGDGC